MKFNQLDNIAKTHDIMREAYERPKLRVFGPVGKLTQAGSGPDSEVMFVGPPGMQMCVQSGNMNAQIAMC